MANEGAIGELLQQLTGSFQQGRDFNLQKSNAKVSAGIRIKQFQLERDRRDLEEERIRQLISSSETEQRAKELELRSDLATERRSRKLEKIVSAARTVPTSEEGKPFAAFERGPLGDERVAGALEELDRPVPASLAARVEEGALTEPQRRVRRADVERTEALTEQTIAQTRQIGKGKSPDISLLRLYGGFQKDFLDYQSKLPITNMLRQSQGLEPLPEIRTLEEYVLNIIPKKQGATQIAVPGLLDGTIAPEDSALFR